MTQTAPAATSAQRSVTSGRGALAAVGLALFCIQLDFFGLNLAIPNMTVDLHTTTDDVQWVLSAYMLSLGSLFILGGRLGDIYGRRPMLLAGISVFTAAAVLCAVAPNLGSLVVFRVLAGVGAALIFPVGVAVVSNAFDSRHRAKALGATFAIANIGTAVGPFVGGGLSQGPGWRWIFWALAPVGLVSLAIAWRSVANSRDPAASRRIDYAGAGLLVAGVAMLSFVVDRIGSWGWDSVRSIGLLVLAAALLAAFVWTETRVREPLVDLSLFQNLPYVLVTTLGSITNIGYGVLIFVVTLYLQGVRGLSPIMAGCVFLAPAILVSISGPIGARLNSLFRPTLVMAVSGTVGAVAMLGMTHVVPWAAFIPLFALAGFGYGLGWGFANLATQDVVDPDRAGEASGVLLTALVSMGGIGLAIVANAIGSLERDGHSQQAAYWGSLRVVALVTIAAAITALVVRAILVHRGRMQPLSMKR